MQSLVAAHPDDALLGAFSLFTEGMLERIIVLSDRESDGIRKLAALYKLKLEVYPWQETANYWADLVTLLARLDGVWFPSPTDAHPHHRLVSSLSLFMSFPSFYATLPVGVTLSTVRHLTVAEFAVKTDLFKTLFPTESAKYLPILQAVGPVEYFASGVPVEWEKTARVIPQWDKEAGKWIS